MTGRCKVTIPDGCGNTERASRYGGDRTVSAALRLFRRREGQGRQTIDALELHRLDSINVKP